MDDDFVYLTTSATELEADIIESKLAYYGIPVIKRHTGTGELMSILAGMSRQPVRIFVSKADHAKAADMHLSEQECAWLDLRSDSIS